MTKWSHSQDTRGAHRRRWALGLLWLVLTAAALDPLLLVQGCQPRAENGPVVLTVGPRSLDLAEFEESFWAAQKADSTLRPDTTGLRSFVPTYVDKLRFQLVAEDSIPTLEGSPRDRLDEAREGFWVEALRKEIYGEAYKVSQSDLARAYELLGKRLHLRYLVLQDKSEAEEFAKALREGAVFAKVAEQRSQDQASRAAGGDIGWVLYTQLDPSIRNQVFSLKPGEIGGPYPWGAGFQIFRVEEEGINSARASLEKERKVLEFGLAAQRVRTAQAEYKEALLQKYHFKFDPAEVAWMTAFLHDKTANVKRGLDSPEAKSTIEIGSAPKTSEIPWTGSPLSPADTGRVVATFDPPEGRVRPALVLDQMMGDVPMAWQTFSTSADVEKLVRALVLERLELREAVSRGIDKRPDIVRRVAREENEIRCRVFTRTAIRPKAHPTPEQVRAYYDAHIDQYRAPEGRRFVALNTAGRETAVQAAELLRQGKTPEQILAQLIPSDASMKSTGSTGTGLMAYGRSPMLDPVIFTLPLNGVSDPIPVGSTFTVAKVVEIRPGETKPFEQVKDTIEGALTNQRVAELRAQMVAEVVGKYPAAVHWDLVRRARLRPPE